LTHERLFSTLLVSGFPGACYLKAHLHNPATTLLDLFLAGVRHGGRQNIAAESRFYNKESRIDGTGVLVIEK